VPTPDRAEVWLMNPGIAAKVRPCLVLGVSLEPRDRVLFTLVPRTTSLQGCLSAASSTARSMLRDAEAVR
jgi:mRNA interferase MazF